jgi:hypothetical protein
MKKTLFLFLLSSVGFSQTSRLIVNPAIYLPNDSTVSKQLIVSLNAFLILAQKPNSENSLIFPAEKIETFIQLDEVNGIEKSDRFKDNFFYKPYLTNVVFIEDNKYLIKVSYIGVNEKTPILAGSFEFIAHKTNNSFLFSSPLVRNTKFWKTEKVGNNIFHYQNSINQDKLKEFAKLATQFDKKLKSTNKLSEFYLCSDFVALQKLIGVDYKIGYNGYAENSLSSTIDDKKLLILGSNSANFNEFDPHDLWHDRLSLVVSRRNVNKPIDEGCAYLYGGSWGISWQDIFKKFKEEVATDKKANWVDFKEKPVNFGESQAKHLMVDYVINALIIQKIEKEKGFDGVWEFLNCGPYENGNKNYYKSLEKLTGFTKENYNDKVWELINNEK